MDACVSIRLGLPMSIDSDDFDQDYPLELDDRCINPAGLFPMPSGRVLRMAVANAHASLADIVVTIVKNLDPVKLAKYQQKPDKTYMISYAKIKKSEADLRSWMDQLPSALRSEDDTALDSPIIERMSKLLQLAHAHAQWILYRPFLHFASEGFQTEGNDRRPYVCAAACLNASREVIQIASSVHEKGLLSSSSWFPVHAIYYATLTLIYCILENREGQALQQDTLESAYKGTTILQALAKNSLVVEICPGLHPRV